MFIDRPSNQETLLRKGGMSLNSLLLLKEYLNNKEEIRPLVDRYIDKPNFGYELWNDELSIKTKEIALCGTVTEICVLANAIILKTEFPEVSISVYKDLCAGLNHHNEAIKCMESQQIKVI